MGSSPEPPPGPIDIGSSPEPYPGPIGIGCSPPGTSVVPSVGPSPGFPSGPIEVGTSSVGLGLSTSPGFGVSPKPGDVIAIGVSSALVDSIVNGVSSDGAIDTGVSEKFGTSGIVVGFNMISNFSSSFSFFFLFLTIFKDTLVFSFLISFFFSSVSDLTVMRILLICSLLTIRNC